MCVVPVIAARTAASAVIRLAIVVLLLIVFNAENSNKNRILEIVTRVPIKIIIIMMEQRITSIILISYNYNNMDIHQAGLIIPAIKATRNSEKANRIKSSSDF